MTHRLLRHVLVSAGAASVAVLGMHGVSLAGKAAYFTLTPNSVELSTGGSTIVTLPITYSDWVPTEPGEYDAWMVIDEYSQSDVACDALPEGLSFSFLPGTSPTWMTQDGRPAYYWGGNTVVPGSTIYNNAPTGIAISGTPTETGTFTICWGVVEGGSFDFPPVTAMGLWVPLSLSVTDDLPDTGSGITGLVLIGIFAGTLGAVASVVASRRRII
jgi:LPXTG-motif cell wall-anchored protein